MKPLMLTREEERAREVMDVLKRLRGLSDGEIATKLGTNRQAVHQRRAGLTRIGLTDVVRLSEAFDVEPLVFLMEPNEAVRWVLDNRPNVGRERVRTPGCITADSGGGRARCDRHRESGIWFRPRLALGQAHPGERRGTWTELTLSSTTTSGSGWHGARYRR